MALTPYPRIWYRDTATNQLNGPLQQPARPPRGQDVVLETAIRGVFPLGSVDATHVYPTGKIYQPCFFDGTTFTNGPTPRWVPQTQIARLKFRAKQEVRRLQQWQGEVRQNYGAGVFLQRLGQDQGWIALRAGRAQSVSSRGATAGSERVHDYRLGCWSDFGCHSPNIRGGGGSGDSKDGRLHLGELGYRFADRSGCDATGRRDVCHRSRSC